MDFDEIKKLFQSGRIQVSVAPGENNDMVTKVTIDGGLVQESHTVPAKPCGQRRECHNCMKYYDCEDSTYSVYDTH